MARELLYVLVSKTGASQMAFQLPPLPFSENALEPQISAETLRVHYNKHHAGYVKKLNELILGTPYAHMELERIMMESARRKVDRQIYNNAAQAWNHSFYWACLSPETAQRPSVPMLRALEAYFGSQSQFEKQFDQAAQDLFGSGWLWLVKNNDLSLQLVSLENAGNPLVSGQLPLLCCDLWEHAYYLDQKNDRAQYVIQFRSRINWSFVAQNLVADRVSFHLKQYLPQAS